MIPSAGSDAKAAMKKGDTWISDFATAAKAPVAVSGSTEGVQIWNLERWRGNNFTFTNQISEWTPQISAWTPVTLSPDGKIVVFVGLYSVVAFEVESAKLLWIRRKSEEGDGNQWCLQLAAVEAGRSLAVRLSTGLEKWSLSTGEFQAVLSTNTISQIDNGGRPFDHPLKTSLDGSVLAADFGTGHVSVWDLSRAIPPKNLTLPTEEMLMAISPDGRFLALQGQRGKRLIIYDVKSAKKHEMPFIGCAHRDGWKAAWSPDGKLLAIAGSCGAWPCLYDAATWKPTIHWRVPNDSEFSSGGMCAHLAFASDGTLLGRFEDGSLRALRIPVLLSALDPGKTD
jgi:WD40 repeat protein